MKLPILSTVLMMSTLLFNPKAAFAADDENTKCAHMIGGSGNIQINRQWDPDKRICFISMGPREIEGLKYRDYYFDNLGQFMVFNSYSDGNPSTETASRDFFVFPLVNEYPDYRLEDNGDITVIMVSGHEMRFSKQDFSIVSFTPGTFTEKPLSRNNKGGVEITPGKGFWFDAGFKIGGVGFDTASGKSNVFGSQSADACAVTNRDFLNYASDGNYSFKFKADELTKFVASKCPQVKF